MGDAEASAQASDAADGDVSVHGSSLRRSKRDSAAKAESVKSATNAVEEPAQRRSQRSVKSTYATSSAPAKEPPPAAQQAATKKNAAKPAEEAESEPAQQSTRRSRPSRGSAAVDSTPAAVPSSPVKTANGSAETAALTATPTRRRPSRRQHELDSNVARQPVDKAHLLLGRFSADDATALCEVVWFHIKENSYKLDVLLSDRSPSRIDWLCVSERLAKSHDVQLTPRECQRLWKFLAYAKNPAQDEEMSEDLMADSDPEDYELTAEKINAQSDPKPVVSPRSVEKRSQTVIDAGEPSEAKTSPLVSGETANANSEDSDTTGANAKSEDTDTTGANAKSEDTDTTGANAKSEDAETTASNAKSEDTDATAANAKSEDTETTASNEKSDETETSAKASSHATADKESSEALASNTSGESSSLRQTLRTSGAQLFPVYDQPSGVPDSWKKPFNLKQSLPLIFVAEKFLKRKVVGSAQSKTGENQSSLSMEVDPSILAAAAMSVTLTGEKFQPKTKGRKRLSDGVTGDDTKPKKPRKKKEPGAISTVAKLPLGISTNPSMGKILLPSRQSFAPSATPPPAPTPARVAFDFFCRLYKENPNIVRPTVAGDDKEHGSSPVTDPTQLASMFANAPMHVRTACEQMANDDQRRFEREQLRCRLWEKARASLQSSPATSAPSTPAVASSSANPAVSAAPSNAPPS